MIDWAETATAAGTLVLAVATFSSVRSAQRSARATEAALLAGIRPILVSSKAEDPLQKIGFSDNHWLEVAGGHAAVEATDETIYLVVSLRNAGNGLAVLDRWDLVPDRNREEPERGQESSFRRLTRDIYVPAGYLGFWQGAIREQDDPLFKPIGDAIRARQIMGLDILYGDHQGGQRMITRFALIPAGENQWLATVGRHWNLDLPNPR